MNLELGRASRRRGPHQPRRIIDSSNGNRTIIQQRRNEIDVYLNDDDLSPSRARPIPSSIN